MRASIQGGPGTVTRRSLMAASAAFAAGAGPVGLNVAAYHGFIPAEYRKQFQAQTGTEVRLRLTASQAPELSLLVTERDHPLTDLCTVTGHRLHQFVDAGIIEPLDTKRLRNWHRIDPCHADAEWNRVDGAIMGVPWIIGANVLVYDTREISPAPDSWGAMFDPKYRGRTTYDIEDFLECTMLLQGADPTFLSYVGKPDAAKRAVDAARDLLIRHKAQVVRFFDEGSELQQMLLGGDAVLAQTYSSAPSRLIMAGQPYRRIVPREGSLSSIYTLAIVKGAPNRDAAYRFLDGMLGAPGMGAALTRSAGFLSAFTDAADGLSPLESSAYGLARDAVGRMRFRSYQGQALSSALIDRAVEEVRAG